MRCIADMLITLTAAQHLEHYSFVISEMTQRRNSVSSAKRYLIPRDLCINYDESKVMGLII